MVILLIQSPLSSAASPNDVLTIVKTDKLTYDPGEDINITISLINPTESVIDLYSGGFPPWHVHITNASGGTVYSRGGEATMIVEDSIGSSENISFNHTVTKYLPPGYYLIEGGAFDAPKDRVLIRVNKTIESDSSGYVFPLIGIAFISGIVIGVVVVLSLIPRKRRDRQTEE